MLKIPYSAKDTKQQKLLLTLGGSARWSSCSEMVIDILYRVEPLYSQTSNLLFETVD